MKRSTTRILTSHAGSLARPQELLDVMREKVNGRPYDELVFRQRLRSAVHEAVRAQVEAGIDVVSDGEMSKIAFADYIADRFAGYEGQSGGFGFANPSRRPDPFPAYTRTAPRPGGGMGLRDSVPACTGPLAWKDRGYEGDIVNLKAALSGVDVVEAFIPSPSPGIITMRLHNRYYASDEDYLFALAALLRDEYRAIVDAGFILQVDAPDVALAWDRQHWQDMAEFRRTVERRVEALNLALDGIPEDRVRFHICWGNYEGPHTGDVDLRDVVDIMLRVRAQCYSVEAANPRHGHEWAVWQDVKLPEGKLLMPGVIDSTTNFVEHPELVAQRIVQYASVVGRENVIAGTDCGFGTGATQTPRVHPEVALGKLRALAEGAALASRRLWP